MYNKFLEPLLLDDPKKTITPFGVWVRKRIYPILCWVVPYTLNKKIIIDRSEKMQRKEPVIFVSTHEFREDVEATYLAAGQAAYVLNGNVEAVMNYVNGITNFVSGLIIVNRLDKASRRAAIDKMIYAIQCRASLIVFPEGTWNKSPNKVIAGMYSGIYEVAKKTGCKIIPIAHQREGNTVYSQVGEIFDISALTRKQAMELVKEKLSTLKWELIEKYSQTSRNNLLGSFSCGEEYWDNHIRELIQEVPFYDCNLEEHCVYIDKDVTLPADAFSFFRTMQPSAHNVFLYRGNERYWKGKEHK